VLRSHGGAALRPGVLVRRLDERPPMSAVVVEHHHQPRQEGADTDGEPRTEHCDLHASASAGATPRLSVTTVVTMSSQPSRLAVERAREAARQRVAELDRSFADIAASVDTANTDDEHDPEGATLAFERAQVVSLLEEARGQVAVLDAAAARLDTGTYGVCEHCGADIDVERLDALPGTPRCVDCARVGVR
jgi:DnaK suppressor protein